MTACCRCPCTGQATYRDKERQKGIHASSHGWCGAVAPTPDHPCLLGVAINQRPYTTSADMFSNSNFTADGLKPAGCQHHGLATLEGIQPRPGSRAQPCDSQRMPPWTTTSPHLSCCWWGPPHWTGSSGCLLHCGPPLPRPHKTCAPTPGSGWGRCGRSGWQQAGGGGSGHGRRPHLQRPHQSAPDHLAAGLC